MNLEPVHEDKRGRIYKLMINSKEYLIIETKAGFARGGDLHNCIQHEFVLQGQISCEENINGQDIQTILKEGSSKMIDLGIPHMYTSITDSVVLEWLDGAYERTYYAPFRKRVEELNK